MRPLGFQNIRESGDLPVIGESGLETAIFPWWKDDQFKVPLKYEEIEDESNQAIIRGPETEDDHGDPETQVDSPGYVRWRIGYCKDGAAYFQ